jgi:leader peptidase (prepilin peptidase)/N-methyltransferase
MTAMPQAAGISRLAHGNELTTIAREGLILRGVPALFCFELIGFGVGLLFGSFLNVCIARLPKHESVVRPGSRCMTCGHPVRWYDNVPVLSWMVLRAKCRDCGAQISWQYPAVELAVGLWFAIAAKQLFFLELAKVSRPTGPAVGDYMGVASCAILGFLLIGLMVMDWQTQRLPNTFTLPGIGIGLFLVCVRAAFLAPGQGDVVLDTTHQLRLSSPGSSQSLGNVFMTGPEAMVLGRVAAVCAAALLLLAMQDGMGLGDVKLLAMIAAFRGFGESLLALFVGVIGAAVYGVVLLARGKAAGDTRLPFGSFLAAGGLAAALFGSAVVEWYLGMLRF